MRADHPEVPRVHGHLHSRWLFWRDPPRPSSRCHRLARLWARSACVENVRIRFTCQIGHCVDPCGDFSKGTSPVAGQKSPAQKKSTDPFRRARSPLQGRWCLFALARIGDPGRRSRAVGGWRSAARGTGTTRGRSRANPGWLRHISVIWLFVTATLAVETASVAVSTMVRLTNSVYSTNACTGRTVEPKKDADLGKPLGGTRSDRHRTAGERPGGCVQRYRSSSCGGPNNGHQLAAESGVRRALV